jgi:hypothetical protein
MNKNLRLTPTRNPVRLQKAEPKKAQDDTPEVKEVNLDFDIDPKKDYKFEVLQKSTTRRFQNLGNETLAYDPQEKRYVNIRYFPTAPTIFSDDQDESFDDVPAPTLGFWNNELICRGEDIRQMEFLMNHPLYEHSPFRVHNKPPMYTLADKDVKDAIQAKRIATEVKCLSLIAKSPIIDLRPVARIEFGIVDPDETAIRNELSERAKKPKQGTELKSPAEKIIDSIDDLDMQRTFHIQNAIDKGIISVNVNDMRVMWVDSKQLIWNLISKKDVVKQLSDWSFGVDGEKFYSILRQKI